MPLNTNVVEVKYGTPQHKLIMEAFHEREKVGRQALELRLEKFAHNEEIMKAYLPESENDAIRKSERKGGKPQYTTIEVPYSYATMLTAHTYLTSVFLARNPILQVQGRHGESQMAEMGMEALLGYQLEVGGAIPALYVWLLDPCKYGHGVLGHYWDDEIISSTVTVEEPEYFLGLPIPGKMKKVTKTVETRGYSGARHFNVRPQDFITDPSLPLYRFQEGEFCIRFDRLSWNRVLEREQNGIYFNVAVAKGLPASGNSDRDMGSSQSVLPDSNSFFSVRREEGKAPSHIDIHEFYFELVPSEWGLGSSKRPERWVFVIAGKKTIISAQPMGLLHNKWPFDVLEYEIGGYELFNRSLLEITEPMNNVLTWLFNSHFFNVRKALNDQFLVDPSMVEMRDLEDPNPGRLVRLKPAAYGRGLEMAVKQFPTVDVTRSHINDTQMVSDLIQRVSGVTDNIMGMVNQGGRKTATEVRTSTSFGMNRLKTTVEWMSACGFSPWATKLIQLTQQMYDQDRKYRVMGDLAQWGERFTQVNPEAIRGFYDFVPVDGSMPVDRFAQANLWQQIMGGMQQMPQVAQAYDLPKIFAYVAQLAGLKNINQFRVNVVPDAVALQNAQSGNVIPIAPGNMTEPGQISGMGTTT